MTAQFKNRLVGTIFLVALGVIFIPDILDGKKTRVEEEFNAIPFAPKLDSLPPLLIDLPSEAASSEQHSTAVAESVSAAESTVVTGEESTQIQFEKPAYIVQLGTFKNSQNVTRLVEKLRTEGFQAHSYPEPPVEGELNRVFVGPNVSKKALEQKQQKLKELTGLSGAVKPFDPLFK